MDNVNRPLLPDYLTPPIGFSGNKIIDQYYINRGILNDSVIAYLGPTNRIRYVVRIELNLGRYLYKDVTTTTIQAAQNLANAQQWSFLHALYHVVINR